MKAYPFAAARVFGTPLAIHPTKGKVIAQALAGLMGKGSLAFDDEGVDGLAFAPGDSPTVQIVDGIAVIAVQGTLVHKAGAMDALCGMRGYNAIRSDFLHALDDSQVRAVCLAVDSGGGEVSGCFELVDLIYESRGIKPVWAILDDSAYSAAYAIASAADRIVVPRTGGTGSVGVVTMHADHSKALEGAGVAITIVTYGARKAFGNEFNPLSKEALATIQADVDVMGDLFVQTVARNRNLSTATVRNTQAGTYLGAAGVQIGFADAVQAPDEAFRSLVASLGTPT